MYVVAMGKPSSLLGKAFRCSLSWGGEENPHPVSDPSPNLCKDQTHQFLGVSFSLVLCSLFFGTLGEGVAIAWGGSGGGETLAMPLELTNTASTSFFQVYVPEVIKTNHMLEHKARLKNFSGLNNVTFSCETSLE